MQQSNGLFHALGKTIAMDVNKSKFTRKQFDYHLYTNYKETGIRV
jgi:hypothetical protein